MENEIKKEIKTKWGNGSETIKGEIKSDATERTIEKVGSYSKVVFWIILTILVLSGSFASYFILQYQKSKELNFEISAPDKIAVAKPFEITANIENRSQSVLRDPKISIQLPDGAISLDSGEEKQIIESELDNIEKGGIIKKTFKLVFVKNEQVAKKIKVNLSYLPENLTTRFETNQDVEIFVDEPAISMNLIAPKRVFSGEGFETSVNYQNISDYKFNRAKLKFIYPSGFVFKDASVTPSAGNNSWDLNELNPGDKNVIAIKGSLKGPDQSFSDIKGQLFVYFNNKEYMINEKTASLGIASSPLSLSISVNNSAVYVTVPNDLLQYQIRYRNNTEVGLNDVVLKINLVGDMFDFQTLETNGSFDSVNNTLTWNASNNSQFKVLQAGAEGVATFLIKTKLNYPIKRMFDKNFSLKVNGEINSPTVPYNVTSDKTVGLANLETKVMGKMEITPAFIYMSGQLPLSANKPTVYEIHWLAKNYSTDVSNVKIAGVLQSGAKWLNISKSNAGTITYNERTGEVLWQIDKVLATKGIISAPLEGSFQVEMTPNVTQIGQYFPILSETNISATDMFTNQQLSGKSDALRTGENVLP